MENEMNDSGLFKMIIDNAGVLAYVDESGRYVFVNREWENGTGVPARLAIGRKVEEIISGSNALLALRTGKTIEGEVFMLTSTGRELSAIMRYKPVKDRQGKVTGCLISSIFENLDDAQVFNEKLEHILEEFGYFSKNVDETGSAKYKVHDIIGVSSQMERLREQIFIAGASNASCLIEGETGTGKELVAHAIHNCSRRSIFPFIRVNCSAIPENLMESEFFGYEEGSFTGSIKGGRAGKFEKAHLGSMFLDEINAMDLSMQPKLLRALQEKEIERIGGVESIPVDVRVITASNMPLEYLVDNGKFRRDLFYRLNIITIRIPPLRQRKDDIYPLVRSFISRYHDEAIGNASEISGEAIEYLCERDWPGNVRELQNAVERAMTASNHSVLEVEDFKKFEPDEEIFGKQYIMNAAPVPAEDPEAADSSKTAETRTESAEISDNCSLGEQKARSEKAAVIRALSECGGNKSKAARMLEISRTLLYKKLEKYNIS